MLIILEGVDGSGKSSLARDIVARLRESDPRTPVYKFHAGPLDQDPVDAYVNTLKSYEPDGKAHVVIDRWHYGEQVYGPLYRGQSKIKPAVWRWMDSWLQSRGARVCVVSNTPDEIKKRLTARGEDFLKMEHVSRVISEFEGFATHDLPTFSRTVRVEGDTTSLVDTIIADAAFAQKRAKLVRALSSSYVGRTYADPEIILVGDKRGGSEPFPTESAFFPTKGNSADFLWNSLPDFIWNRVAAVNINDDKKNLEAFFMWMEYASVVALGAEASKALSQLGVKHSRVPHPQWVRRFHNSKQSDYGHIIYRAATSEEDFSTWPNS